ncbi:hypothetical protein HX071_07305 [Myroides marinus]|uniref:Uncharacterized protein n=1 Tax=Myroides marinus TaxID=703342 RepID=A0A161SC56_9FLAO|nr:hypothetical protein [Myroides marinus]KZE83610.1 hypothetical protein AV926_04305 [Myroides marinus]MDM1370741.1 hypothetical protein [Myroides marinus]MDM1502009.1 hypothetical protein [Myroides marinus]
MKIAKIILNIVTLFFMGWALVESSKDEPNIWVQIIGVALFFYGMAMLMQKTPSNTRQQGPAEREFDAGIKKDLINQAKEEENDVK